jgi:hypothetical protein
VADPPSMRLTYDRADAAAKFRREAFLVEHELACHPLLGLDALGELADRLPSELVEHNLGTVGAVVPGGAVPRLEQTPGDLVRGIETNACWMALPIVLPDGRLGGLPGYQDLFDELMDELAPIVPGGRDAMSGFHSVIFLAATGSTTPSHVDGEIGFLLHARGRKRLSIGRFPSAECERDELEAFHRNAHRNTGELPVDVRHVDLEPGQGVHVPPLVPHWVENGPEVAISLSVGFQTPENLRRARVYRFNARARRLGLAPRGYGSSAARDRAKSSLVQGASQVKRRIRG